MRQLSTAFALILIGFTFQSVVAQEASPEPEEPPVAEVVPEAETGMTLERLQRLVAAIDPEARIFGNAMELTLDDIPVMIITDPTADRMRAMVPIRSAQGLSSEHLMRLMQANFDTALDARYAVAQGRLWSVYIHPLSPLERDQLLSALVQTINVARTYGRTYSGGAMSFGGGDSNGIFRELFEELQKKGEEI